MNCTAVHRKSYGDSIHGVCNTRNHEVTLQIMTRDAEYADLFAKRSKIRKLLIASIKTAKNN